MRVALTLWVILWFIIDPQIGYLITAPAIVALGALTYAKRDK